MQNKENKDKAPKMPSIEDNTIAIRQNIINSIRVNSAENYLGYKRCIFGGTMREWYLPWCEDDDKRELLSDIIRNIDEQFDNEICCVDVYGDELSDLITKIVKTIRSALFSNLECIQKEVEDEEKKGNKTNYKIVHNMEIKQFISITNQLNADQHNGSMAIQNINPQDSALEQQGKKSQEHENDKEFSEYKLYSGPDSDDSVELVDEDDIESTNKTRLDANKNTTNNKNMYFDQNISQNVRIYPIYPQMQEQVNKKQVNELKQPHKLLLEVLINTFSKALETITKNNQDTPRLSPKKDDIPEKEMNLKELYTLLKKIAVNQAVKNHDINLMKQIMRVDSMPPKAICLQIFQAFANGTFSNEEKKKDAKKWAELLPIYVLRKFLGGDGMDCDGAKFISKAYPLVKEALGDLQKQGNDIWSGVDNQLEVINMLNYIKFRNKKDYSDVSEPKKGYSR